MTGLSAVIICQDEEPAIEECLRSVQWMDEIVVVDSGSRDATQEICRRYTDRVFGIPWQGYGRQKTAAVERALGGWVFSIDADERVTPELKESIQRVVAAEAPHVAYRCARRNYFLGRWLRHGGWYPDRQTRLFRKGCCRFSERPVHETLLADGPVGNLQGDLLHYTYDTLGEYILRQHRYAALSAQILYQEGKRAGAWSLPLKPFGKFAEVYLYKGGFRDGPEGLVVALLASLMHLVRYARLWEMGRAK